MINWRIFKICIPGTNELRMALICTNRVEKSNAKFKPVTHKITYVPLGWLHWATMTLVWICRKNLDKTLRKEEFPPKIHCCPLVTNLAVHK